MSINPNNIKETVVTAKLFRSKSGKSLNVCLIDEIDHKTLIGIGFLRIDYLEKLLKGESKVATVQKFVEPISAKTEGGSPSLIVHPYLGGFKL